MLAGSRETDRRLFASVRPRNGTLRVDGAGVDGRKICRTTADGGVTRARYIELDEFGLLSIRGEDQPKAAQGQAKCDRSFRQDFRVELSKTKSFSHDD